MSSPSLALVTAVSELLQVIVAGETPSMADLERIANRVDSIVGPTPKLVIAEPCTPQSSSCGVKGCHQPKVDGSGYCSFPAQAGTKYCGRHDPNKERREGSAAPKKASKVAKVKEPPAQESVPVNRPTFSFSKTPAKVQAAEEPAVVEKADDSKTRFSGFRPRGLATKLKANFFKRTLPDDEGDIEFVFTDDALGGQFVYSDASGDRTVIGRLTTPVNKTDEVLPDDFMEYVDQDYSDFEPAELTWFTANRVSLPVSGDAEE